MRIAVCGAHAVGKTALVGALAEALADHVVIEEPYHAMTALGHVFEDPPSIEDYEAQLELSMESVEGAGADAIFDRCPADILAYLAVGAASEVTARHWARAKQVMASLDVVAYVPIEQPDRIEAYAGDYPRLRKRVDSFLRAWLQEDELVPSGRVHVVRGAVSARVASLLRTPGL